MRRGARLLLWTLAGCASTSGSTPRPSTPVPPVAEEHAAHAPETAGWTLAKLAQGATLLGNLGEVHRAVSTRSPEAQAFFDQGLALTYGFNHDEAARSFALAAALDPACAMCFWGAAYTLGTLTKDAAGKVLRRKFV